ncbi:MAG TPA: exodeoxyribonuclease VII large subunit [Chlamydiales bacterium]|nr:exodeoxyribonuclease VII large subunit [Chlamydiales bacterium]
MIIENKVYSVSELTFAIKAHLEPQFRQVFLKGEISNFKRQSSGHFYFSLKDANAQISCAFFKGSQKNLTRLPKDGDHVQIVGEISVYPPRGNYQMIVRSLQHEGVGDLLKKLHELKEKLKNMGWLDSSIKKPIPKLPKRIGIVTSPTGAAVQDMLNVLTRRFSNLNILINPVKVQGPGAAEEIAQAINEFNNYQLVDVIIVGRGGGSIEDLWAFNEEIVAKSIYESKIPIVSAVGHETDTSISDLVADLRAPTPSAAAELITKEKAHFLEKIEYFSRQCDESIIKQIRSEKKALLQLIKAPVFSSSNFLNIEKQKLDDIQSILDRSISNKLSHIKTILIQMQKQTYSLSPKQKLEYLKQKFNFLSISLNEKMISKLTLYKNNFKSLDTQQQILNKSITLLNQKKSQYKQLIAHLEGINPKNLLKKGYSILFNQKDGSTILSTSQIKENESIKALVSDGEFLATVTKIKE